MSFILAVFAASLLSLCFVFGHEKFVQPVSYGPRPFYLVDSMSPSPLKTRLMQCMGDTTPAVSTFSIGHRGAALQFPEHTKESYVAAYRMGAGIIECKSIPHVTHKQKAHTDKNQKNYSLTFPSSLVTRPVYCT